MTLSTMPEDKCRKILSDLCDVYRKNFGPIKESHLDIEKGELSIIYQEDLSRKYYKICFIAISEDEIVQTTVHDVTDLFK